MDDELRKVVSKALCGMSPSEKVCEGCEFWHDGQCADPQVKKLLTAIRKLGYVKKEA